MWNSEATDIFSCSLDGFVCQIDIKKSKLVSKFHTNSNDYSAGKARKASRSGLGCGREPLHSICLHPSEQSVIVGSLSRLTWIDLDTKSPLKTFQGGHVGFVNSLTILQILKQCYVLSAGESSQDYTISAWKLSLDEETDSTPNTKIKPPDVQQSPDSIVAKFGVNESVRSLFVLQSPSDKIVNDSIRTEDEPLIGVITKTGTLHCFKHEFASIRKKKPIKPKLTIQVTIL